jgi:hypothetical protein
VTSNRTLEISSGSGMLCGSTAVDQWMVEAASGVIAKAGMRHGSRLEIATGLHIESVLMSSVCTHVP